MVDSAAEGGTARPAWWRSLGPALITACVVFGPGSLVVSAKVGATYRFELLWLLALTGVVMAFFLTMGARIGVAGGATPCTLLARQWGRPAAAAVGGTLCLICTAFQFSNNMAFGMAAQALLGGISLWIPLVVFNLLLVFFLLTARDLYRAVERIMKVMVGVILLCFVVNLFLRPPPPGEVCAGFVPHVPRGLSFGLPRRAGGQVYDPLFLVVSLLGTTFSVGAAFYQGNLVREKGWTVKEYHSGIRDAVAGTAVLAMASCMIMVTAATVIPGRQVQNVADLAATLRPLLGPFAYGVFCVGLLAVSMNPFLINAVIGGSVLADGLGLGGRLSNRAARFFTVGVLAVGLAVALCAERTGRMPVEWIVFGQALTVVGNPLMAASMICLANSRAVMGEYRNGLVANCASGAGFLLVLFGAFRVLARLVA